MERFIFQLHAWFLRTGEKLHRKALLKCKTLPEGSYGRIFWEGVRDGYEGR